MRGLAIWTILLLAQSATVERAWDLLARGKRDEAVVLLRKLIQQRPVDADARLLLGSILTESGDHSEAVVQLREAVRLRPRSAAAHNGLGEALKAAGETGAARAEFETAVTLDPSMAPAHESLGLILLEADELVPAARHLDTAIRLFGNKEEAAFAHYLRAKVYTAQEHVDRAAASLSKAVALRADFAEAWSDLGQAKKTLQDSAGALVAFERSVELNPDGVVAQTRLGTEYLSVGKPREAIQHLERALRLSPENQSALHGLQLALRQDGQIERSKAVATELAELLHKRDRASQNALTAVRLNNEGADLEKNGHLRSALDKYKTAVDLYPEHAGIRSNYAVALLRLGRWDDGIAQLREAIRLDPKNQTYHRALADALAQAPKH